MGLGTPKLAGNQGCSLGDVTKLPTSWLSKWFWFRRLLFLDEFACLSSHRWPDHPTPKLLIWFRFFLILRADQIKINCFFQVAWNQAWQKCSRITFHSKSHQPQEYLQRNRLRRLIDPEKRSFTLPETNSKFAPEKGGFSFSNHWFSGACYQFHGWPSRPKCAFVATFVATPITTVATPGFKPFPSSKKHPLIASAKVTFWHDAGVTFLRHSTSFSLKSLSALYTLDLFSGY